MSKKKLELVRADYQGMQVSFTEEGWFNATEISDRFGKRPIDWLRLPDTEKYLAALELRSEKITLLKVKRGGRGKSDVTWFHPKLGVPFARWLDVNFAVWCDEQIDALIRQKHPHFDWRLSRHKASSSFKVMEDILKDVRAEIGKATLTHHYVNEARLIRWAMTGDFKAPLNREELSVQELDLLALLEERNTVLLGRGLGYEMRKGILEQFAIDQRLVPGDSRRALRA